MVTHADSSMCSLKLKLKLELKLKLCSLKLELVLLELMHEKQKQKQNQQQKHGPVIPPRKCLNWLKRNLSQNVSCRSAAGAQT